LAKFIIGKCIYLIAVYLMASGSLFLAMKAIPEDPIELKFEKFPDPEQIASERERMGLNRSWLYQYGLFHLKFLTGNWERSLQTGRLATDDVKLFFPATLELSLIAMAIGIFFGSSAALFARVSPSRWSQNLAMSFGTIGLTVPIFWIGLLALVVGSLWLGIFPLGGRFDLAAIPPPDRTGFLLIDSLLAMDGRALGMTVRYLTLPALCLAVFPAANVSSVLYARLNEPEVNALYTALRARGFGSVRIVFRHLLRVAGAPVVTVIGTSIGALLGGAFLTETVFSWPGIGRYVVTAIIDRDLFVAQYLLLMLIMLVFGVAFLSDIVARWLDVVSDSQEGGKG
jgi:ABC-type dipeptide/oligopeptide/nickel transport system permease component